MLGHRRLELLSVSGPVPADQFLDDGKTWRSHVLTGATRKQRSDRRAVALLPAIRELAVAHPSPGRATMRTCPGADQRATPMPRRGGWQGYASASPSERN